MASELIIILATILVAAALVYWFPNATRRWFDRIMAIRRAIFLVFLVLLGFVLIGSGSPLLILWGAVTLGLVVVGALFRLEVF